MIFNREETYQWAQKLIDGDEQAIEELVLRYQHVVINLATTEANNYPEMYNPSERQDAVAEANYALVKCLNDACGTSKLRNNYQISTYIKQAILNRLRWLRERLHMIRIPMATMRRHRKNGDFMEVPHVVSNMPEHCPGTNSYHCWVVDDIDLEPLEREILEQKIVNKQSTRKLAEDHGISRYKINRIYKNALDKVRQALEEDSRGSL